MEVIYTGTKIGSQFNIKDPIPKGHNHEIIYHTVCPQDNCNEDCIENQRKKLTIIMVKAKTQICYFTY